MTLFGLPITHLIKSMLWDGGDIFCLIMLLSGFLLFVIPAKVHVAVPLIWSVVLTFTFLFFVPPQSIPYYEVSLLLYRAIQSVLALSVFALILAIAPWRFAPLRSHREYGRMFLILAAGVFCLRCAMWGYGAFHAGQKERLGSFRMKGITYAQDLTRQWRFTDLSDTIEKHWLYPIHPTKMAELPPQIYDRTLIDSGLQKAEAFRRSLFISDENGIPPVRLIAQAIVEFQRQSQNALREHVTLERFKLNEDDLLESMQPSSFTINGFDAFGYFSGRWYGLWETNPVDHDWKPVEFFNPTQPIPGSLSLALKYLQYAWIGDGFAWNAVVSTSDNEQSGDVILGIVYHVINQNPNNIILTRPHVGILPGLSQLIWLTAGEIFLEEKYGSARYGKECYAITGFRYSIQNSKLTNNGAAFQALYSCYQDQRQPFYTFEINLDIP